MVVDICFLDLWVQCFWLTLYNWYASLLLYIIDHSQYHNRCGSPAANLVHLDHFNNLKFWVTSLDSQRANCLTHSYHILKVAKRTWYTTINIILNSFSNANDMPITAVMGMSFAYEQMNSKFPKMTSMFSFFVWIFKVNNECNSRCVGKTYRTFIYWLTNWLMAIWWRVFRVGLCDDRWLNDDNDNCIKKTPIKTHAH